MKEISEKKKKVLFVVGAVLCFSFLVLSFALIPTAAEEYSCFSIDRETLAVTHIYLTEAVLLLALSAVSLILGIVLFITMVMRFSGSTKKVISAIAFALLFVAVLALSAVGTWNSYDNMQYEIDRQKKYIEDNTLRYTEVSIGDFLDDVNRFPKKYEGKTVTLEGWVRDTDSYYDNEIPGLENDRIETFTLSLDSCSVTVIYYLSSLGASMPRALKGDYAVVTGEAHVFYSEKTQKYVAYLDNSTYEIKDKK